MLAPNIRHLHKKEIPFLASFLAGIFVDNGIYMHIFADHATRKGRLEWLFEKNLLLQKAERNTWVMVGGGVNEITDVSDIIATVTFLPSAEKRSTIADYIQKGLLAMPLKFGFKAFKNLLKANKLNEDGVKQVALNRPYWYLTMVAVAEEHRGKGIAKKLIQDIIQHTTNVQTFSEGYASVLLTTQLESNVHLYHKLGFVTIDTTTQNSYTNWTMKKELVA